MDTLQTAGIGAICLALIGLVWKIWNDSSNRTDRVIEVSEKTGITLDKLSRNVELSNQKTDAMMSMVVRLLKDNKDHD